MEINPVLVLLVAYAVILLVLARRRSGEGPGSFLLAGRALSLPALVATMVTTWYGGILGVGEYAWRYGLSTWVVFGLPYYLAAIVFGLWLAPRLRRSNAVSIPDLLNQTYGRRTALVGAAGVWAGTWTTPDAPGTGFGAHWYDTDFSSGIGDANKSRTPRTASKGANGDTGTDFGPGRIYLFT